MNDPEAEPSGYQQHEEGMQKLVSIYYYPPLPPPEGILGNFCIPSFITFSDPEDRGIKPPIIKHLKLSSRPTGFTKTSNRVGR